MVERTKFRAENEKVKMINKCQFWPGPIRDVRSSTKTFIVWSVQSGQRKLNKAAKTCPRTINEGVCFRTSNILDIVLNHKTKSSFPRSADCSKRCRNCKCFLNEYWFSTCEYDAENLILNIRFEAKTHANLKLDTLETYQILHGFEKF